MNKARLELDNAPGDAARAALKHCRKRMMPFRPRFVGIAWRLQQVRAPNAARTCIERCADMKAQKNAADKP